MVLGALGRIRIFFLGFWGRRRQANTSDEAFKAFGIQERPNVQVKRGQGRESLGLIWVFFCFFFSPIFSRFKVAADFLCHFLEHLDLEIANSWISTCPTSAWWVFLKSFDFSCWTSAHRSGWPGDFLCLAQEGVDMCKKLLEGGAPGLHFYTLNLEKAAPPRLSRRVGCFLVDFSSFFLERGDWYLVSSKLFGLMKTDSWTLLLTQRELASWAGEDWSSRERQVVVGILKGLGKITAPRLRRVVKTGEGCPLKGTFPKSSLCGLLKELFLSTLSSWGS